MEQQLQQERIVIENDDEIEIDLKDLVLEILSFWKWVLFALIIGAVTARSEERRVGKECRSRCRDRILYQQVCNGAAI